MDDLLILCYHAVSERWPSELAISPDDLSRHLGFFQRRGYRGATLSEALERKAGRTLVVTFDDAFASVAERALPVLSSHGVPATVFVPTGYVDDNEALRWSSLARWAGTPFEDELRCMSWGDLRALAGEGWEIGSHTHSHPDLRELGEAEIAAELNRSRAACEEHLQRPCRTLAYPFGAHDPRVVAAVGRAGYEAAAILDNEIAIPAGSLLRPGRPGDRLRILREGVYRGEGWARLLAKCSPAARRLRASRPFRRALHRA